MELLVENINNQESSNFIKAEIEPNPNILTCRLIQAFSDRINEIFTGGNCSDLTFPSKLQQRRQSYASCNKQFSTVKEKEMGDTGFEPVASCL